MSDDPDREAKRIFAEARDRARKGTSEVNDPRRRAAAEVANAAVAASVVAGWSEVKREADNGSRTHVVISPGEDAEFGVLLRSSTEGVWARRVSLEGGSSDDEHHAADLKFDALSKKWVSDERDETIVPEPGKPYPKRSAAAVVAELVVKVLEGAAAEKKETAPA